jgi:arabinogalactan endo-1,4-beta-galactosidase
VEAAGIVLRDSAGTGDAFTILRRHGFTAVRLRLWHTPSGAAGGLDEMLDLAKRARRSGMKLLLDLHYSDHWADPGRQNPPAAWRGLPFGTLADSVRRHTREVLATLVAQGTPPDLVQLGNEITSGMLWDTGRVGGRFDTPAQWRQLGTLLGEAARGVREVVPAARIVLHVDCAGDAAGCRRFFDRISAEKVDFDVVGLSYYPWWHGPLEGLERTLATLARAHERDVLIVETAYPWTLTPAHPGPHLVGLRSQLHAGFPATIEGQGRFLARLRDLVVATPKGRGIGVFYWEPAWIGGSTPGWEWENAGLFGSDGRLLDSADSLGLNR